jgi:hypothetical protein
MTVPGPVLSQALAGAVWERSMGKTRSFLYELRSLQPLPDDVNTYTHTIRFSVLWSYDGDASFLPSASQDAEMFRFEQQLRRTLERDGLSFLMRVLTCNGSRHWVFYTSDGYAAARRITQISPPGRPYPIRLVAENDPGWRFIRGLPEENRTSP